jgi:hypothetical protein
MANTCVRGIGCGFRALGLVVADLSLFRVHCGLFSEAAPRATYVSLGTPLPNTLGDAHPVTRVNAAAVAPLPQQTHSSLSAIAAVYGDGSDSEEDEPLSLEFNHAGATVPTSGDQSAVDIDDDEDSETVAADTFGQAVACLVRLLHSIERLQAKVECCHPSMSL